MRVGVYPGTFDPITAGHIDIILRSLKLVDKLYVAISANSIKNPMFSLEERIEMIQEEIIANGINPDSIKVEAFSGLLVNYAKEKSITVSFRGLRASSDFEYEFQMACMNTILDKDIETVFLPASSNLQLVSSKLIKEVSRLGGDTGDFISSRVKARLKAKI